MPPRKIHDESGHTMEFIDYENTGLLLPVFRHKFPKMEDKIASIPTWKCKQNDVFVCATPKAGTHWIWEVVSMLIRGRAERIQAPKEIGMLELLEKDTFEKLQGELNYGSWFDYHMQWEKDIRNNPQHSIHIVFYEDVKEDPLKMYAKIAEFLGMSLQPGRLEEIVKLCDFDRMKKEKIDVMQLVCKNFSQFRKVNPCGSNRINDKLEVGKMNSQLPRMNL
ncbi:hypothetical protein ScPMuIL_005312 [Solemya velum]